MVQLGRVRTAYRPCGTCTPEEHGNSAEPLFGASRSKASLRRPKKRWMNFVGLPRRSANPESNLKLISLALKKKNSDIHTKVISMID